MLTSLLPDLLLERESYLTALAAAFVQVQSGEGRLIILSGEAGSGKSSLAEHFAKQLAISSKVQRGYCEDLFAPRPLGAFDDILSGFDLSHTGRQLGSVGINLLFPTILQKITQVTDPLLWIIEDVQWADHQSLDLIRYLARRIHRIPLMLIVTVRQEDLAIHTKRAALMSDLPPRSIMQIDLPRLSRSAVAQLTQSIAEYSDSIFTATGGNPFFVKALLQAYSESSPDARQSVDPTTAPQVVRDRILSKLCNLSVSARLSVEFLSVLPGEISNRYLQGVIRNEISEQGYALCQTIDLEDCLGINLLERTSIGFRFSHGIAREVIEASLPPMLNRQFHALTLKVLDQDPLAPKAHFVHHAKAAQATERLPHDAYSAAVEASMAKAFSEAAAHYEIALGGMQSWDQSRQARVYAGWAYAQSIAFGPTEICIARLEQASQMWRSLGDLKSSGATLRRVSTIQMFKGDGYAAMSNAREAVAILEACPPSASLGMAYSQMAFCAMAFSDRTATQFWAQQALSLSYSLGSKGLMAHAKSCLGAALFESDQLGGEALLQEGLALCINGNSIEAALIAHINLSEFSLRQYNFAKAGTALTQALDYSADVGLLQRYFHGLAALAELMQGNLNRALQLASELTAAANEGVTESIVQWPLGLVRGLANARIVGDQYATQCLEQGFELSQKSGLPRYILPSGLALVETYWLADDNLNARAVFEVCVRHLGPQECPWLNGALATWGKRLSVENSATNTAVMFEPKGPLAEPYQLEMDGKYSQAAIRWGQIGAPFEQALCLMQSNFVDLQKSVRLLRAMGAESAIQAAKRIALAKGMQSVPRGYYQFSRSHPFGLTAKENAVLNCLLEGSSNAQIAATLNRSERTVEHHVSGILVKAGAKNRSDLLVKVLTGKVGKLAPKSSSVSFDH